MLLTLNEEQQISQLIAENPVVIHVTKIIIFGKVEYTIDQVEMLPTKYSNCCYAMFIKKESSKNNSIFHRKLPRLNRIYDVSKNKSNLNPQEEFEKISKDGFIEYVDNKGQTHKVKVKCKESTIVKFGDEKEIGKKLSNEECYQYQILDSAGDTVVTIYKSKKHNQFSMSQLVSVYDNLNKTLIKECNEIILSSHVVGDLY